MPALLERAKISLLVSTYQSGRLIALRNENGVVNTHFRFLPRPMGIAVGAARLAVGTQREIVEYRNQPAVAAKLEPAESHDACYLPLRRHVTGDVSIHDMAYGADGELWFVNTRFSCPRDDRFRAQLRAALATAIRLGPHGGRPLSSQRVGRGRWTPSVRDRAGHPPMKLAVGEPARPTVGW
jgi:hypothetical protein